MIHHQQLSNVLKRLKEYVLLKWPSFLCSSFCEILFLMFVTKYYNLCKNVNCEITLWLLKYKPTLRFKIWLIIWPKSLALEVIQLVRTLGTVSWLSLTVHRESSVPPPLMNQLIFLAPSPFHHSSYYSQDVPYFITTDQTNSRQISWVWSKKGVWV